MEDRPWESQVNMPPTPTPATAFDPSSPIHAISVILYNVAKNDDAMIGIASFIRDLRIGPFVKLLSKMFNLKSFIFMLTYNLS